MASHDTFDRRSAIRRHHDLSRDSLDSADLLFRNLKHRDAVPALRRALEEELRALLILFPMPGEAAEPEPAWIAAADHLASCPGARDLFPDPRVRDDFAALDRLERQGEAFPEPGRRIELRALYRRCRIFLNRSERLIRERLASPAAVRRGKVTRTVGFLVTALLTVGVLVGGGIALWQGREGGLLGEYYRGSDLREDRLEHTRIDRIVDFSWAPWQLPPDLDGEEFSVRWTGRLRVPATGKHRFTVRSDDGARLWIDGELVADAWIDQPATDHSATIELEKGSHRLRLEYYQRGGEAECRLRWKRPGHRDEVVHHAFLRPPLFAP